MQASNKIKPFIGREEALCLAAYDDDGTPAWCFGHQDKSLRIGQQTTTEFAVALLDSDTAMLAAVLQHHVTVPILQQEADAMISLGYNIGAGALARSELLAKFNAGDKQGAADEFLAYFHGPRRQRERAVFLTGDYGDLGTIAYYGTNNPRQSLPIRIAWPGAAIED